MENNATSLANLTALAMSVREELFPNRDAQGGDCEAASDLLVEKLHAWGIKNAWAVFGTYRNQPHVWVQFGTRYIDPTCDQYLEDEDPEYETGIRIGKTTDPKFQKRYNPGYKTSSLLVAKQDVMGQVYLLHFNEPYKHARHYLGWALNAESRIQQHENGTGARLTQVIKDAGIGFQVAKIWDNQTRRFERNLKNQGGLNRQCPICKAQGLDSRKNWQDIQVAPETDTTGPDYTETSKAACLAIVKVAAAPTITVTKGARDATGLTGTDPGMQRYQLDMELDDQTIGHMEVIAKPADSEGGKYEGPHLKIHEVFVDPDFRRKGYGTLLYNRAKQLAKELGLPHVYSDYTVSEDAQKVWNKLHGEKFRDVRDTPVRYRMQAAKENGWTVVYHGTNIDNVPLIKKQGILPSENHLVWAADTLEEAQRYGMMDVQDYKWNVSLQRKDYNPDAQYAVAVIRLVDSGLQDIGGVWQGREPIPPQAIIRFDIYNTQGQLVKTASSGPPPELYHGTSPDNVASIRENGLGNEEIVQGLSTYLSDDPDVAKQWGEAIVVVRTRGLKLYQKTEEDEPELYWISDELIPLSAIKSIWMGTKKIAVNEPAKAALYHGTNIGRAIKISEIGLVPGITAGNTQSAWVYLSDSEQYAQSYADRKGGSTGAMLRITGVSAVHDENTGLKGDYKTQETITPDHIEVKASNGWEPITEWVKQWKFAAKKPLTKEYLERIAWRVRNKVAPEGGEKCQEVSDAIVEELHRRGYTDAFTNLGQFRGKDRHPHAWVEVGEWEIDATQDQFASYFDDEEDLLDNPIYVGPIRKTAAAPLTLYRGVSQQEFAELQNNKIIQPSPYNKASIDPETAKFFASQYDEPGEVIKFEAPLDAVVEDEIYKGDYKVVKPITLLFVKTAGLGIEQLKHEFDIRPDGPISKQEVLATSFVLPDGYTLGFYDHADRDQVVQDPAKLKVFCIRTGTIWSDKGVDKFNIYKRPNAIQMTRLERMFWLNGNKLSWILFRGPGGTKVRDTKEGMWQKFLRELALAYQDEDRKELKKTKAGSEFPEDDFPSEKDWAIRSKLPFDEQGRVRLYHATPTDNADELERIGLRKGSYLTEPAESAAYFARRDRVDKRNRRMTPGQVTVFECWLPLDSFQGRIFATTTRDLTSQEISMKRVLFDKKKAAALPTRYELLLLHNEIKGNTLRESRWMEELERVTSYKWQKEKLESLLQKAKQILTSPSESESLTAVGEELQEAEFAFARYNDEVNSTANRSALGDALIHQEYALMAIHEAIKEDDKDPTPKTSSDSSFKTWFAGSKVVDKEGNPVVCYHGTDQPFSKVDMGKGAMGVFWVTSDRGSIERGEAGGVSNKHILGMYVNIKKPAGWVEYEKYSLGELKRDYDGVILPDGEHFEAIVFKPSQVRMVKQAKVASALPPAPGTGHIPAGAVRCFHYTQPGNVDSIRQQGLLKSKGRGDDSSYSGPSAGVWASTQVPNYNALRNHIYIEFWAMSEEISHNANYPGKGEDATAWGKSREQHVIMAGNVPTDHIIAIHEPWQDWARYLEEGNHWEDLKKRDPKLIEGCADGTMDKLVGADCAEAVRWMSTNDKTKTASIRADNKAWWILPSGEAKKLNPLENHGDAAVDFGLSSHWHDYAPSVKEAKENGGIRVSFWEGQWFFEFLSPTADVKSRIKNFLDDHYKGGPIGIEADKPRGTEDFDNLEEAESFFERSFARFSSKLLQANHFPTGTRYVYHGTTEDRVPGIMKEGLRPGNEGITREEGMKGRYKPGYIYVTKDSKAAQGEAIRRVEVLDDQEVSHGKPVVLKIDLNHSSIKNIDWEQDPEYENYDPEEIEGFRSRLKNIPPTAITVMPTSGSKSVTPEEFLRAGPRERAVLLKEYPEFKSLINKKRTAASSSSLRSLLESLKGELSSDAQLAYNDWKGDNGRGLCDDLAEGMAYTINVVLGHADPYNINDESRGRATALNDAKSTHFWVYVEKGDEKYGVDIPYGIYEFEKSPRFFVKKPDVKLTPEDVHIFPVKSSDDVPWDVIKDYKRASVSDLKQSLLARRAQIAHAAQRLYDEWTQDEEGVDEVYGGGGICDAINTQIQDVLMGSGISCTDGGAEGDDHAWTIAFSRKTGEVYGVDISPNVYEQGSGYSWKKISDVQITSDDVEVFPMDISIKDLEVAMDDDEESGGIGYPPNPDQLSLFSSKLLKSSSVGNKIPKALEGLAAEARKCNTFEEFRSDFSSQIKHGRYYHVTEDPRFQIDPQRGPTDQSSLAAGGMDKGKLMITSDLGNWTNHYEKSRSYVAIIDMSKVPRSAYYQVNRGFGNEFFVTDPSQARVVKVITTAQAAADNRYHHGILDKTIGSNEDLENFYNLVKHEGLLKSSAHKGKGHQGAGVASFSVKGHKVYTLAPGQNLNTSEMSEHIFTDHEGLTRIIFDAQTGVMYIPDGGMFEIDHGDWVQDVSKSENPDTATVRGTMDLNDGELMVYDLRDEVDAIASWEKPNDFMYQKRVEKILNDNMDRIMRGTYYVDGRKVKMTPEPIGNVLGEAKISKAAPSWKDFAVTYETYEELYSWWWEAMSDLSVQRGEFPINDFVLVETPDPKKVKRLAKEIMKSRKFMAIVIDNEGEVIDGHHRYEAAKLLGFKTIPAVILS